jgi:hypothetical protein
MNRFKSRNGPVQIVVSQFTASNEVENSEASERVTGGSDRE